MREHDGTTNQALTAEAFGTAPAAASDTGSYGPFPPAEIAGRAGKTLLQFARVLPVLLATAIGFAGVARATTPGTPGTPQPPTNVYQEDFENRPGPTPIVRLTGYTGATGQTYTADAVWLSACNGWVAAASQPVTSAAQVADCSNSQASWNSSQQLAEALGLFKGESAADAANNFAVSAFTAGNPGVGRIEFQTATNIPFVTSNRFVAFGVDVAAVNCNVSAPLLQFYLLDGGGTAIAAGTQVNACASTLTVDAPAVGVSAARAVNVGTYTANGAVLISGSSIGVRMLNNNGSGTGNDHSFDNIQILDVTPQLDKAFNPAAVAQGATSTLTFTITNTTDLGAKNGWSFTDTLPAGLTVAAPAATTTCPSGVVTAAVGSTSIAVTGNLGAGMASCTVTAAVTSAAAGTYSNGPGNVTAVGLNPPGTSTVTFSTLPDEFLTCPATTAAPPQDFTLRELWRSPGTQVPVYQTPLVGDLFGTGQPVVVIGSLDGYAAVGTTGRVAKDINIYRGSDGTLLETIVTPLYLWGGNAALALADVDGDGQGEILLKTANTSTVPIADRGRLIAYRNDGTQMWESDQRYDYALSRGGLSINVADFNGDGVPEVYVGNQIFNARTGARLASATTTSSSGCPDSSCLWGNTTAADVDGDGKLELIAGNVVYKVDIVNPDGEAGNSLTVWRQADPSVVGVGDGWTAIADMDLDGAPDVVVARSANGAQNGAAVLYVWDPRTGQVKGLQTAFGTGGSQPFIGDIDGDGAPEIVLTTANRLHAFEYAPGAGLSLKWTLVTSDDSALTTLAMFDFNSDGVQELVYRDDTSIRIINGNGATAQNLATFPCMSGTGTEMPVIADLDGSGEARIITACGDSSLSQGDVRVFASDSFPWAKTRPVWNQQAYFITHVNDDLTIPAPQFPSWTSFNDPGHLCSDGVNHPLNSFQAQVTTLDPNTGCPVICAPASVTITKALASESGSIAGVAEPGETLTYTITLDNSGGLDADPYAVIDALDANVTFVSADHGGALVGGNVQWTGLTVPAAGSLTLTVVERVADPIPADVTAIGNVAYSAGGDPPDCTATPMPANCTSVPTPAVVDIAKALTAESGSLPGIAEPGEQLTYTITLTNTGGADATNYAVTDPLDPNVTLVSADNGGTPIGADVRWTGLVVPGGGQLQLTVVVQVDSPIAPGAIAIGNVAYDPSVGPPDCDALPAPPNCTSVPTAPQVTTTKALTNESGSQPGIAEPGEQLTYQITLTNTGGSPAAGYAETDALDPNTTFVSADNGGAFAAGAVSWSGLTVPASGTLTLTVVVTVNTPIPPGVTQLGNVAYQTGTIQPPCPPAGPACVITPTSAQVTTVKALTGESGTQPGVAEPGEQLTYTITLTNTGGSAATGYAESDRLDPNTTFVSASNGGVAADGIVNWTGLTVPAGGTLSLTVVVGVNSPIPPGIAQLGNVAYPTGTTQPPCPPAGPACVITPTASHVTIGKVATSPAPTGTPNEYQITYTATVNNTGGSAGSYDLTDALTFNGATVTAIGAPVYASSTGDTQTGALGAFTAPNGGTIVTGESIAAAGVETWTYTVTYTITDAATAQDCADPDGGLRNHAALGGGAAGAPAADTCSGAPNVNVLKTASAPVATGNPNEFTLTYTVNVSNSGTLAGTYTLTDTLSFNGATVSAISAPAYSSSTGDTQDGTLGSFTAPSGGTIVSGESIGAGGAETWVYAVTYTITNPTTAEDCADPSGGLRNDAALGGSLIGESTTCTGAPAVVIGKSASGPTPTGNPNEYTLVYLVTVQNNGTLPGLYDLDDTFTFPGVSNVGVSAVQHGGADPLSSPLGTLSATGGTIVTGETIAAGSSETYTYSVVFTVDDAAVVGNCALGGGLVNQASLGGSSSGQVGTCSSVPDVAIAKSASGPTATGTPNQYTLTYTVTVSNNGGAEGTYDLADAFAFAGATVDTVSAVTHGGGDPLSSPLGTLTASGGTIVTGETIAAGASETYTYTVTFTLTDPATANDCTAPAGGLRNAATLGGSVSGEADTCSGAPVVTLAKVLSGESGTQPGIAEPGETLTYTITLSNSGSVDATAYGVTDPLDPNVIFVSASNGGTFAGGVVTWTNLTIPAGSTVVLTVVVTVDSPLPSGAVAITNLAYADGGTPPDCAAAPTPPGCVVTPTEGTIAIAKSVVDANGNGIAEPDETLTYTITLTNTNGGDVANYGVTDPLDANVTFVSASNGGAFAGGAVSWTGLTIPSGGTLNLTVVVTVDSPLPAGIAAIGNLAYETGGTPPDCTTAPLPANCTILPTPAVVSLAKSVTDANGNGEAEPGETLTYTITLTNTGGSAATNVPVTDPLDANTTFVSASNGGAFAGGVVSWSGLTVPANGTLGLTVVVTVHAPLPGGVTAIGNLVYQTGNPPPDCTATPLPANCTSIPTAPHVVISKTASTPVPTGNPNEYQLTYVATVHNDGGSGDAYNLDDTLTFNSATVTAIGTPLYASPNGQVQDGTLGAFTAPSGGTIVMGEDLDAGGIETWTYTVTYTITDSAIADNCSDPNGGLRNSATASGNASGASSAGTCTGAPSVSLLKTAGAPVPTGTPNEFTLTYTVNVSNSGTLSGVYDLSDVLMFNGAAIGAISTPAYSSSSGDPQDGTLGAFGLPDGGVIVTGESISAGGAQTWVYTVTYTITNAATAQDCADPAGGLRNDAALGGSLTGQSTTCTGAPAVAIGKSASGPVPTGNPNEYALTYLVTVQNNGSLVGTYDLDDAFTFAGVSGVSVGPVQHGGADPLGTPLGALAASGGNIVTGETIAAGSSETYTYVVTFTIDDATAVGTCAAGGGLANNAALGGSSSGTVGTCSDVPSVALAKTASAPTPTGTPNQYAITYTVTVDNAGAATGSYDLADAFAFAGATIDAVSAVTHAGPDPLATTLGTLTTTGGTIVTGETIAGGSSESYGYTVTFTVTDPAAANDCTAPAGGLRNTASLGGSASGEADTCTGAPSVTLAKVLSSESGTQPGIAEPGETLTYTITLTNSGATDATAYGVSDPLDPNVTFVSASNGGAAAGGTVTWTNLTVPANGTLALTVVVTVDTPIAAGVSAIGNLAYQTGSTPPDCTATPTPPACVITPTPGVVSIVKTVSDANGDGLAEPGETLTYTITLRNTSGGDALDYGVTDPLDANVTFVSASNGGTFGGGTVSWSGLTISAGQSLALTVVVTVNTPLPANVTQIGNLAYQTGGTPPDCAAVPQPANCTVIQVPLPGAITLVKTVSDANGNGLAEPGETLNYTITLSNGGGQDVTGYGVTDPLDANTTFVSADNGGSAAGNIVTWTGLTIPAGGSLALHVVVTVNNPLPAGVTQIGNLAYATGGTPPDCTATPLPPACAVIVTPPPGAPLLSIAKHLSTPELQPGGTAGYTLTVANVGTAAATDVTISDPIAAGLTGYSWTCAASGGASCANASGSGAIAETIALLPPGGVLVYTVIATIAADPPASIANTASVTPSGLATCAPSGTPAPCSATAIGTVAAPPTAIATPATDVWMLMLLGLGLLSLTWRIGRRVD